jgi:hypothetical protein
MFVFFWKGPQHTQGKKSYKTFWQITVEPRFKTRHIQYFLWLLISEIESDVISIKFKEYNKRLEPFNTNRQGTLFCDFLFEKIQYKQASKQQVEKHQTK